MLEATDVRFAMVWITGLLAPSVPPDSAVTDNLTVIGMPHISTMTVTSSPLYGAPSILVVTRPR